MEKRPQNRDADASKKTDENRETMKFEKGTSGNPNGRPKGATGDLRKYIREALETQLLDAFNSGQVQNAFDRSSPATKLRFITDALRYVLTTPTDADGRELPQTVTVRFGNVVGLNDTPPLASNENEVQI